MSVNSAGVSSDWHQATVKWFNGRRGFGFLTRGKGTPDILIHRETLKLFGLKSLLPKQVVQVRYSNCRNKGSVVVDFRPGT